MKKEKVNKYVVSRKILFLSIIIVIPVLALFIWFISGFFGNKITAELKDKFEVQQLNYTKSDSFNDFNLKVDLTSYTKATSSASGSLSYKLTMSSKTGTSVSNLTAKITVGDYWSHYVAPVKEHTGISLTTSELYKNGSISIAYTNKNGWGIDVKTNEQPNVYLYLTYTYVNEYQSKSTKDCILTYSFESIFTGSIVE